MLAELRRLYFSRHHFSRDITGRLAPFTSFVIFVFLAYPDLRREGLSTGSEYLAMAPIGLPILGAVLYIFVGLFVGAGVNAIAVLFTRLAERIPGGIGDKFSYKHMYKQIEPTVEWFFTKYFGSVNAVDAKNIIGTADKLDALKDYLRAHNPGGFANISRQFARVDMTRAFFVYGLLLVAYELALGERSPAIVATAALAMVGSALATPRRLEKVVRSQWAFLVAGAKLRDERPRTDGSEPQEESTPEMPGNASRAIGELSSMPFRSTGANTLPTLG